MATQEQATVTIGDECFSILEPPSQGAVVVKEETEFLLGSVDLQCLVADLGRLGNLIRLAYNGVAGYTDLQIKIREVGYNITKLCDKSAVTVAKFKQASGSIVIDLKSTYEFLLDGLEDIALATLSSVATVAKDMAAAADQLHQDFDNESKRVEEALKLTMMTRGSEDERKKQLRIKEKELQENAKLAAQQKLDAENEYQSHEERYKEAEKREKEFQASASNLFKAIANAFVAPLAAGLLRLRVFNTDADLKSSRLAREEKLQHLEEMKKQREIRSKALQDIAEFTKQIENCKDDSELAEVAIGALHSAVGGLQQLSKIMLKATLFWRQMQVHCEQLTQERMKKMIETAMAKKEQESLRVWTSNGFKTQAIKYYAKWVALDGVCATYMGRIKETQSNLYAYLTENLTLDEARIKVRDLAAVFGKELEDEQKAICEKNAADAEEIKRLTRGK